MNTDEILTIKINSCKHLVLWDKKGDTYQFLVKKLVNTTDLPDKSIKWKIVGVWNRKVLIVQSILISKKTIDCMKILSEY